MPGFSDEEKRNEATGESGRSPTEHPVPSDLGSGAARKAAESGRARTRRQERVGRDALGAARAAMGIKRKKQ